jgi:hypothetical protein
MDAPGRHQASFNLGFLGKRKQAAALPSDANAVKWNDRAYADLGKHILSGHLSAEDVEPDVLDVALAAVFADEVLFGLILILLAP